MQILYLPFVVQFGPFCPTLDPLAYDVNSWASAEPESFVRVGPTFFFFFFSSMRGRSFQIQLLASHHRRVSEETFNGVSLAGR